MHKYYTTIDYLAIRCKLFLNKLEVAMLDFIVLGEIPGTSIQISYSDVLRLALACALMAVLIWELHRYKQHKLTRRYTDSDQIAL